MSTGGAEALAMAYHRLSQQTAGLRAVGFLADPFGNPLPALPGKASALPPGAFEIGYTAHDGA